MKRINISVVYPWAASLHQLSRLTLNELNKVMAADGYRLGIQLDFRTNGDQDIRSIASCPGLGKGGKERKDEGKRMKKEGTIVEKQEAGECKGEEGRGGRRGIKGGI